MARGRMAGKVVLLTGIGSGLGRTTAQILAREGAIVVGCGRNPQGVADTVKLVEAEGGTIEGHAPVNLSDRASVEAWVSTTVRKHGKIDVLYNNASQPRFAPFGEQSEEDYLYTIDNELNLVWYACQLAWPHLAKSRGAIVNIGSVAGMLGARALPQAAHAAAKGAVLALTRQLAAEGVAVGIRVNSVCPGVMATPPVLGMLEELGENSPVAPILERTIDGCPGEPSAVAYAGLYFASDEAKWVTGSNIVVDGGAHAYM